MSSGSTFWYTPLSYAISNGKTLQQLQRDGLIGIIEGLDQYCYQRHIDIPIQFSYCVGGFDVILHFFHPKSVDNLSFRFLSQADSEAGL